MSVEAIQRNNPNFTKSLLPLLTRRMLFGTDEDENTTIGTPIPSRKSFLLEPAQADAIELLTGNKMGEFMHKIDASKAVNHCTHPHVFGGKTKILWNSYLSIRVLARKIDITKKKRDP